MAEQSSLVQDMPTPLTEGHARQISHSLLSVMSVAETILCACIHRNSHQSQIKEDTGEPYVSAEEIDINPGQVSSSMWYFNKKNMKFNWEMCSEVND